MRLKYLILPIILILFFFYHPSHLISNENIYTSPDEIKNLQEGWDWATENGLKKGNLNQGFWIGYSIELLMGEHTYYASSSEYYMHFTGSRHSFSGPTLREALMGVRINKSLSDGEEIKAHVQWTLQNNSQIKKSRKKIKKEVAILFLIKKDSTGQQSPAPRLNNLSLPFKLGTKPLYWLKHVSIQRSFDFLNHLYKKSNREKDKKRLISVIGNHPDSGQVVPFLTKILKSSKNETLRGRAALKLGEHPIDESFNLLYKIAKKDASLKVRRYAVSGLSDMGNDQAADALIDLAKNANHPKVRTRAVSALGDIASRKAIDTLKELVIADDFTQIQKRAVYAFEDLPNNEGIPYLIQIAKTHPKLQIRKSAIYCLGDSGDPRALNALIEIIKE